MTTTRHNDIVRRLSQSLMTVCIALLVQGCTTKQKTTYEIPEPKAAGISAGRPYEEKLQLPFDDRGMDVNVDIAFDEAENLLTLTLTGSRPLMAFRSETAYANVFRHPLLRQRQFLPGKLPYPVLVQPETKITLSKQVWKGFNKKRSKHIFNPLIGSTSPELQPLGQSSENTAAATLLSRSVTQYFRVDPKATKASLTLRNLLVAERNGMPSPAAQLKRNQGRKQRYRIVYDKDLNLTYNLTLQRDPCFGTDSLLAAVRTKIESVKQAYANLHDACPDGTVSSEQEQGVFNQHRSFLLSQFASIADSCACPALQQAYAEYNGYVKAIRQLPCVYVKPLPEPGKDELGMPNIGVKASYILDTAHRLDNIVSQILVSHDTAQIHDLTNTAGSLIETLMKAVRERGLTSDEQRDAYTEFLKARSYFSSAILRQ